MLPPEHPDAPKYWMHETSGELIAAMNRYLAEARSFLEPRDVDVIKAYLWRWVNSPVWGQSGSLQSLRMMVTTIKTESDISTAIAAAIRLGMDPL